VRRNIKRNNSTGGCYSPSPGKGVSGNTLLPECEEEMDVKVKLSLGLIKHHKVKIYQGFGME
jgi:hypothetical protein